MHESASPVENLSFDPSSFQRFRFLDRSIDEKGEVSLRYALDDSFFFEEKFSLPAPVSADALDSDKVRNLLALLHWVAGVSYYKAAVPDEIVCEGTLPGPAAKEILDALYSEGLGEFAVVNDRPIPNPDFPSEPLNPIDSEPAPLVEPDRILVPVGGGKDSTVAIEVIRHSGIDFALFSVGNATPIHRTVDVAEAPRFLATRQIDPLLIELNSKGALNGHVPVTAIVSCVAMLTAAIHGFNGVALANERSASSGNRDWQGTPVNHQFSKGARTERLLQAAVSELTPDMRVFSILRMASELTIARTFARLPQYHPAFTSCNRIFHIDPGLRSASWCCECDKCRFVFLILAPFLGPDELEGIFGAAMLDDLEQLEGFKLLMSIGQKPFECVGEEKESAAAVRLLASDPRWRNKEIVVRLTSDSISGFRLEDADLDEIFALSNEHSVPSSLLDSVHDILGS